MGDEDDGQSLVVRQPDAFELTMLQDQSFLSAFLQQPSIAIIETVTGAFAVGKAGLAVSGGRLALGLLKGKAFQQFASEFKRLRDAGKLPDEMGESKHGFQTWAELMAIIDSECPDEERLEALKGAFYAVNKVNATDEERITAYELWQIVKQLKSGEVILLKALFEQSHLLDGAPPNQWHELVAKRSGLV